jgi:hypothetical protein
MDAATIDAYTGGHRRRTPGTNDRKVSQEVHAMSGLLFLAAFFVALAVAGAFGLTADSREGGDWSPTHDGRRCA